MILRFYRNLRFGYGFSILILLVVSAVLYLTLQDLLASNRLAEHSSRAMQKFEQVLSVMKDAETGQRGYLLIGIPAYLEPYNGAQRQAPQFTDSISRLKADNPVQERNISGAARGK